ncbi:hypothetical protein J6590_029370 [Homalodisca vitripennis]|nr:hypothetical protein J6590_029370 [Homalodisca vitripennis]
MFGINQFRRYQQHKEFLLETDNQALSWLLAHPRQLGKIGRWYSSTLALSLTAAYDLYIWSPCDKAMHVSCQTVA